MMTFSLLRPALALGVALTLAACGGGGGKATYPINVHVTGLQYEGLVLSANVPGISDLPVAPAAKYDPQTPVNATFPQQIEYGVVYDVLPKGATDADYATNPPNLYTGAQPKHQHCGAGQAGNPRSSTAGLLASIDVVVNCYINTYPVGGKITGLTGTGLVLINGSAGGSAAGDPVLDATTKLPVDQVFSFPVAVAYNATYGVSVLTQPTGQTCTVTGGGNGKGAGTMDDAAEKNGGVTDILVTCKANS